MEVPSDGGVAVTFLARRRPPRGFFVVLPAPGGMAISYGRLEKYAAFVETMERK